MKERRSGKVINGRSTARWDCRDRWHHTVGQRDAEVVAENVAHLPASMLCFSSSPNGAANRYCRFLSERQLWTSARCGLLGRTLSLVNVKFRSSEMLDNEPSETEKSTARRDRYCQKRVCGIGVSEQRRACREASWQLQRSVYLWSARRWYLPTEMACRKRFCRWCACKGMFCST